MSKDNNWRSEHKRLWAELVPAQGRASTLQGELIRIAGKLTDEAYRNGNINWNDESSPMLRFVREQISDPETFSDLELEEIREAIRTIIRDREDPDVSGDGSPYYLVSERVVDWCIVHPDPLPLPTMPIFKR